MPESLQLVVNDAQALLPDLTTARALRLANKVHREILAAIPELRRDMRTLALTAGIGEYDLAETDFQIDQVTYANGTAKFQLLPTTTETLTRTDPLWRTVGPAAYASNPPQFYLTTRQNAGTKKTLGLYPPPDSDSVLGTLTLYGSMLQAADLLATDSVLPGIVSSQVYVEGVLYYASREIRPALTAAIRETYAEQIALNKAFVRSFSEPLRSAMFPNSRG